MTLTTGVFTLLMAVLTEAGVPRVIGVGWWIRWSSSSGRSWVRGSIGTRLTLVPGFQIHIKEPLRGRSLFSHPAFWLVRWEGWLGP